MNSIPEIGQTVLNFVDGRWEAGAAEKWTDRYDPADQSVLVARAPDSSREDARRAIEAAARAAERWNQLTAPSRGRLLFEWLAWIDAHKAKLAELLTREEGKILPESVGEVKRSMDILEFTAGMGRRLNGRVFPSEEDGVFCYATPQPLGVVGLISPWNFPVAIPVWKLAPALVAGNTAVLKPSPLEPDSRLHNRAKLQTFNVCGHVVAKSSAQHRDSSWWDSSRCRCKPCPAYRRTESTSSDSRTRGSA